MKRTNLAAKEETIKNNFSDIVNFYKLNKREPLEDGLSLYERLLAKRLKAIKELYKKYESLSELDVYGILAKRNARNRTGNNIVEENEDEDKFSSLAALVRHSKKKKVHPPQTAKKIACQNFDVYKKLFIDVRIGLGKGNYIEDLITGSVKEIKAGDYFSSNETIHYIADIKEEVSNRGTNLRLKIITEDGLEFDILYQSFVRGLYRNVKLSNRIIAIDKQLPTLNDVLVSGYIYILGSLNDYPELTPYQDNLFKINFATETTDRKINESHLYVSYLEAPVHIVSVMQCFSLDMTKIKREICSMLKQYELKGVKFRNCEGEIHYIKGWYNIPLNELEDMILTLGNK